MALHMKEVKVVFVKILILLLILLLLLTNPSITSTLVILSEMYMRNNRNAMIPTLSKNK